MIALGEVTAYLASASAIMGSTALTAAISHALVTSATMTPTHTSRFVRTVARLGRHYAQMENCTTHWRAKYHVIRITQEKLTEFVMAMAAASVLSHT